MKELIIREGKDRSGSEIIHTAVVYRLTILDGIRLGIGLLIASAVWNFFENLMYSFMAR